MQVAVRALGSAACLVAAVASLRATAWTDRDALDALAALSLDVTATSAFFALVAVGVAAWSRAPLAQRLGLGPGRLPRATVGLLLLGILSTSLALDSVLQRAIDAPDGALAQIEAALSGARGGALLLALVAVGVAPAVGEELLFRGLLQRALAERFGAAFAIVASALLFGAAHLDTQQGSAAFALGLYLGAVAHATGGVRAAIACHAVNNAAAVLGVALAPEGLAPPLALAPIGLLIGASAVALAYARASRPEDGAQ